MFRALVLSVVVAMCLSGFPPIWQSKQLPRCCKTKHGCTMTKRAVTHCAFNTCDREDVVTALKMPRAISAPTVIGAVPEVESLLVGRSFASRLSEIATDIDHPPRPLLV